VVNEHQLLVVGMVAPIARAVFDFRGAERAIRLPKSVHVRMVDEFTDASEVEHGALAALGGFEGDESAAGGDVFVG